MKKAVRMNCNEIHFSCNCLADDYDIMMYHLAQTMIENEELKNKIKQLEQTEFTPYAHHLNLV